MAVDAPRSKGVDWGVVLGEFKILVKLALPTIVQGAAQQGMLFTDQIFLGHLGTVSLAASALGNTYNNILWYFLIGASTALDTLGAQAYGASNQAALVTVTFTAAVVLSGLTALSSVSLCFGKQVATYLFGQEPDVAQLVGQFCWGLLPGMWPLVLGLVLMKYLQTQNMMMAPALVTLVAFVLNIGFNAMLINLLGFKGAPLATSLSRFIQFLLLAWVVYRHECKRSNEARLEGLKRLGGPGEDDLEGSVELQPLCSTADSAASPQAAGQQGGHRLLKQPSWFKMPSLRHLPSLRDVSGKLSEASSKMGLNDLLGGGRDYNHSVSGTARYLLVQSRAAMQPAVMMHFLKLALPGGFMMSFEAGSFDFTTGMAGHLGSPVVTAAHSAMFGFVYLTYVTFPYAISTAATIRVGNLLGAGQPLQARLSSILCIISSLGFMLIVAIVMLIFRNYLGYVFSSDPEVLATVALIAPLAALFQVSDGLLGSAQGVLRGCGRQTILMLNTIVGFWLVGILLGYFLAFKAGLGLIGLWIGIASGDWSTALLHGAALLRVNWSKESERAVESLEGMQVPESPQEDLPKQEEGEAVGGREHLQVTGSTAGVAGSADGFGSVREMAEARDADVESGAKEASIDPELGTVQLNAEVGPAERTVLPQ